jgi:hypothetical protein
MEKYPSQSILGYLRSMGLWLTAQRLRGRESEQNNFFCHENKKRLIS